MQQPDRSETRTTQVMNVIRAKAATRELTAGDRLPSIRGLAATLGVSPSTVVTAYDRLAADGVIRSRPGSGFYLSSSTLPPLQLSEPLPERDRAIDPLWVSRQSLDADPSALKPGCGWLPSDWLPIAELRRGCRTLAKSDETVLTDYSLTRGSPALRRMLMTRWAAEGIEIPPDQILLTTSATQALDLICRFLLRPGDTVLVDDPCYFNFTALLRVYQVKIVSVPYTSSGPDLTSFETVVATERPVLYITNSALHNPTTATLTAQSAHRLLTIAAAHNLTIVEDDVFADFEPEPSVRLATLDGLNQVIKIGSFSKTLSASVRCGYIAARSDWIENLVDLQVATSFAGPSPIATELIAGVLAGGSYRKHMDELRRRLAQTRRTVAEKLQRIGIEPWLLPRGGFYLWCRLPDGCDATSVARAALTENVVLAPGNAFSASQSANAFMRFNVAQCTNPRVMPILEKSLKHRSVTP